MSGPQTTTDVVSKRILGALVAWNLFDIAVHVAVDEVKVLRVTANVIVIAVASAVLAGGPDRTRRTRSCRHSLPSSR